jgi:GntR family transcriptional regulator
VRERRLLPGARLPSVRQLAADLEINPNTVARAYSLMERDGIIDTARRRGTRVADAVPARAAESLASRVEDVADRVIRETAHLGIEPGALVKALHRRLGDAADPSSRNTGKRS